MEERTRNLTVSQTLDEILGLEFHSSTSSSEKNALNSPIRPPTRHGRESSSSNEENKDPMTVFPLPSEENHSKSNSDDEFLQKLNDMRRRSLVAMNIQPRESPIVPVAKERTEAVRLPVTLEADEPTMTKAEKEPPPLLEAPSEGSSNRTFRIIDKAEEIRPAKSLLPIFGKSEPSSSITTWLRNKMEKERAVKESARKAEAAKKEAEEERRKNAARLFERWKAEHDEEAKRKLQIEKQRLKEKKQRESQEKKSRQDEAQKMFEVWKRERSKSMTEIHRKEVDKEKKKKEEAEKQKQQRREEADAAFRAWVAKKKKGQRAASSDPKKKDEEDKIKDFRQMMAQEAYEAWLEMKMHERDIEATLKPLEGPIVPWIPPNNTVPRRFVGSAQRRRAQKSHMQRSQSAKARPRTNPPLR